jgi:serine/threonine-protein kinase
MKRKSLLGAIASFTLLSMTALDVAGDIKLSLAQTEVPLTIRAGGTEGTDGFALLSLTVPNQNTTSSAYGGQLRFYDVHIAKMFEVTDFLCKQFGSDHSLSGYEWFYSAANGQTSMGRFRISCSLARDIAIAYGLGKTERTAIGLDTEGGPPESNVYSIPILNITGSKVPKWMDFVQRFRPISNNNTSNAPVAGTDDFATIREVVLRKLSRPDLGTVGPVILVGDYALATWMMREMEGQTLLKREGRHWRIITSGGGSIQNVNTLIQYGVPRQIAEALADGPDV